jgi:hypothetical protein
MQRDASTDISGGKQVMWSRNPISCSPLSLEQFSDLETTSDTNTIPPTASESNE